MGVRYEKWVPKGNKGTIASFEGVKEVLLSRSNLNLDISLSYGDHGLTEVLTVIAQAVKNNKKIALYADYDVDGTMSCVSWVWFFRAISFHNFIYYIPDRFKEGYGPNLNAIKRLVKEEGAELIITMDCGITANKEAAWCKENNVEFICTDHHKINPKTMPDCLILNPVLHPNQDYQFLCGCGITYVLLRKLGDIFPCENKLWLDLLALAGLATICDIVPLNSVNHKIARLGVKALNQSKHPLLVKLLEAAGCSGQGVDEQDIGFKLGPRINAVGRLDHGNKIVSAFIENKSEDLLEYMNLCNEERKEIQEQIWKEAFLQAEAQKNKEVLFLGGAWHIGVVGIVAARLAEHYWKPVWLYNTENQNLFKGSARSIPGFDVTEAMTSCSEFMTKFGGHKAAGGFTFAPEFKDQIHNGLLDYAQKIKNQNQSLWVSSVDYDCALSIDLINHSLLSLLDQLKPFGHGFSEPKFLVEAFIDKVTFYCDKNTGAKKHTCVFIKAANGSRLKVLFFNSVYEQIIQITKAQFLITIQKNYWKGKTSLSLIAYDYCEI